MGVPVTNTVKKYTLKEFLTFEETSTEKHEFHNGEIFAMSGGTLNHSIISGNTLTSIKNELKKANKKCLVANSDLKIRIEKNNKAVFPDVMVLCDKPEFVEDTQSIIKNPMLIIEVLSKSTKNYDKSYKFEYYRTLPSFKEYVVVYQTIPKVQVWYMQDQDLWHISEAFGLDKTIQFRSLDITLKLSDIYEMVSDLGEEHDIEAY